MWLQHLLYMQPAVEPIVEALNTPYAKTGPQAAAGSGSLGQGHQMRPQVAAYPYIQEKTRGCSSLHVIAGLTYTAVNALQGFVRDACVGLALTPLGVHDASAAPGLGG